MGDSVSEDRERATPERVLTFAARSQLLSADDVMRALRRMGHEIVERNHDPESISVVGLQTGGVGFANRIAQILFEITGSQISLGVLDVSFYRDDLSSNPAPPSALTRIDHDLTDRTVIVVDDVLFTGRTVRAALNALSDWGRPAAVELAVMVDRGHREFPIRPDFVGKNLPTARDEAIVANLDGVWIGSKEAR